MEGFYGVEVKAGQKVKPKIPEDHVLRLTQIAVPANAGGAVSLVVTLHGESFTIASLDAERSVSQMGIDLVIKREQGVTFSATGTGSVHMTGYLQPIEKVEDGSSSSCAEGSGGVPFENVAPPPFPCVGHNFEITKERTGSIDIGVFDADEEYSNSEGMGDQCVEDERDKCGGGVPPEGKQEQHDEFYSKEHLGESKHYRGGYTHYRRGGGYSDAHQVYFRPRGHQGISNFFPVGHFIGYNGSQPPLEVPGMGRRYGRGGSFRGRGYMGSGYRGQKGTEMRRGFPGGERYIHNESERVGRVTPNWGVGRGFSPISAGFHPYYSRSSYPFPPNQHITDMTGALPPYILRGGPNTNWNRGGYRGNGSGRSRF